MDSDTAARLRREYIRKGLREADAPADPMAFFDLWFAEAVGKGLDMPNACALATADAGSRPSVRMVLLKERDDRGFLFYSNLESRKALEMGLKRRASLLFYWGAFDRQIRIEGSVEDLPRSQAETYFHSRPFESQCAAAVSDQSRTVASRDVLESAYEEIRSTHESAGRVPLPEHWGGWRLVPESLEFWQGAEHRLHDRLLYRHEAGAWTRVRLAP